MFPIYTAVAYDSKVVLFGGTTQPVLIDAIDEAGNISSFVVKIFSAKDIDQNDSIFKEFLCTHLIKAFDLHTPEVVLIYFNDFFKTKFPELAQRITSSGKDYHFGSTFSPSYKLFKPGITPNELDIYDMQVILAIDAAIYNVDRRKSKPNFLIKSDSYLLIDHEKTFGLENLEEMVKRDDYAIYYTSHFKDHIFKSPLNKGRRFVQIEFQTFKYWLEEYNLSGIDDVREFVEQYNLGGSTYEQIFSYFRTLKEKKDSFIFFLKNFIS
jgi:hypothetical protein